MIMDNRFLVARRRYDPDATRYINAVQLADGQALEPEVAMAVDAFVRGCKADGIWSALKASCILCGARTISGALVPLAGTAPTPYNFASGDYSRTTGLVGYGATKYLDSNRAANADGLNDFHLCVYASEATTAGAYAGAEPGSSPGATHIGYSSGDLFVRNRSSTADTVSGAGPQTGTIAINRQSSTECNYLFGALSGTVSRASQSASTLNHYIFRRNGDAGSTDARLAFYSIGSALDLAALDTRVSTLVSAIAAAL